MPIGASKLGVLGAGLVPGGSVTFNSSGNWPVPPGVKKVSITGKGGTGNPGVAGNAGNPGNPGTGGGGRGNAGNAGGNSPTVSGSAANPQTFNCVPVTPGTPTPITVGSPGGQIVISWNPQ